jgi:flagellar biosynthesis/type III secretory pathway M-ring protein FliF/YscJ
MMANAKLIEMLAEKDKVTVTAKSSVDTAATSVYSRLNQMEISLVWLIAIGAAAIVLMFLLSVLWQMVRRRRRRKNYEMLRKKRLEEKYKDNE